MALASFPCHAYSHLNVLPKHLSRVGNMTDRSSKLSQISKSSSSLKNDSIKKHCQISCSFFFFPLGNPPRTRKNYVCSHLTSPPDVGSQGQPVRVIAFSPQPSDQAELQTKPSTLCPISELHKCGWRNTSQEHGCYRWSRTQHWASIPSRQSAQPGQAFSSVLTDARGHMGLL